LVLNRVDMILPQAQQVWMKWFKAQGVPYFTNAQDGKVWHLWHRRRKSWGEINQRRRDRGMLPRPVRAVIGFPNVGKSALINRLLQRRVESAARPGVTRQLR